ncbi:hypothetical protein [Comamonas odontotermitis]|nr:hypothetical protein [Comamonas odontotermitis]
MRLLAAVSTMALGFLLGLGHDAQACSLSDRQLTIQLEPRSAELGAQNARVLAEWFLQWRDGLGIESLIVVAPAVKSQKGIADERLHNVARIFERLNIGKAPIAYEVEVRGDSFPDVKYLNSLDVSVQPACIKSGTCCQGGNTISR